MSDEQQDERVTCPACDGAGDWEVALGEQGLADCGLCRGTGLLQRLYARKLRDALDALLGGRPAWLLVAADRMAAGEPEADVMRDYGWRMEAEA